MALGFPRTALVCLITGIAISPLAQAEDQTADIGAVEVTATPMPEHLGTVPQSVDVITHAQLEALHATDLRSALMMVAGVDVGPSGDNGPAASVPQFQGLAEFDAFLLLVDGVPVGGAFNPDLATLDLAGVDRIEVIRGSAPVKYGATSFVGVINVIHVRAGAPGSSASASFGSYGTKSLGVTAPLLTDGPVKQTLVADYRDQGLSDARAGWDRYHVLSRTAVETDRNQFRFDIDAMQIRARPGSPSPLAPGDTQLSPLVPVDSNANPSNAKLDEDRVSLTLGDDADLGWGSWDTVLSDAFTHQHNIRGFLRSGQLTDNGQPNADGFDQDQQHMDLYFDTHLLFDAREDLSFVVGFSYLYGNGQEQSNNDEYFIHLDGSNPPSTAGLPIDETTSFNDLRSFAGLYGSVDWIFAPRWDFQMGLQLNHDVENSSATDFSYHPVAGAVSGGDHRSDNRPSGMLALSYEAWQQGEDDLIIYGNYRNTFKPAAVDFGPEYTPQLLEPETARQYEFGLKGNLMDGHFDWEASSFLTDMDNTVVNANINGGPGITNGGQQRFEGVELEADWHVTEDLRWQTAYSYHRATYRNFLHDTDGTVAGLTQDAGNRLELSPLDLFSTGLFYMPDQGFTANVVVHHVGSRYFDPENSVSTPAYTTYDAGVGYRFGQWSLSLQGRNLNDTRPPVSNSELGDSQSYLLPARFFELSASVDF
ncbi:MAG TPA: TonB-dependent receptor [Gammaproteobacteria bacterium]|nr:TonB-dependent receptor [Gammaproteobacteria bacterium]